MQQANVIVCCNAAESLPDDCQRQPQPFEMSLYISVGPEKCAEGVKAVVAYA